MRLGLLFTTILTCGCRQIFGVEPPTSVSGDALSPPDTCGTSDSRFEDASPPTCFQLTKLGLAACPANILPALAAPADMTFDTSDSALCDSASPEGTCLIATSSLAIGAGAHVTVTGELPLIVFATGTITIAGTFDLASHVNGTLGPGANPMSCVAGTLPQGGGGGAGGSFGSVGARGGDPGILTAGSHGTAAVAIVPVQLRGGCSGQDGGGVTGGGAGGGALLLIANAAVALTDSAVINASGQSGAASASPTHGGNGGGAGGMIVLSAPAIQTSPASQIFANGGHGGGGSSSSADGSHGTDPTGATSGGGGGGGSGPGGAGYPTTTGGGTGATQGGGGGGGGGAGVIDLVSAGMSVLGAVSPPAS